MDNRLADSFPWADSVGAAFEETASLDGRFRRRSNDLVLVKSLLIMLGQSIKIQPTG